MKHRSNAHFDEDRRDRETITAVRHRLEHSGHKGLRRVRSQMSAGTVTLSGFVTSEEDRELAIDIVRSFAHVDAVIDDIAVELAPDPDEATQREQS